MKYPFYLTLTLLGCLLMNFQLVAQSDPSAPKGELIVLHAPESIGLYLNLPQRLSIRVVDQGHPCQPLDSVLFVGHNCRVLQHSSSQLEIELEQESGAIEVYATHQGTTYLVERLGLSGVEADVTDPDFLAIYDEAARSRHLAAHSGQRPAHWLPAPSHLRIDMPGLTAHAIQPETRTRLRISYWDGCVPHPDLRIEARGGHLEAGPNGIYWLESLPQAKQVEVAAYEMASGDRQLLGQVVCPVHPAN